MITPISVRSRQMSMASIISCTVSGVKALCTCGRLMLILAMPLVKREKDLAELLDGSPGNGSA